MYKKSITLEASGKNNQILYGKKKLGTNHINIEVIRKKDVSMIVMNKKIVKAFSVKEAEGKKWYAYSQVAGWGESKKTRIESEQEAVLAVLNTMMEVVIQVTKQLSSSKWEEIEGGYRRVCAGEWQLDLYDEWEGKYEAGSRFEINGKSLGIIERGLKGMKRADSIFMWRNMFEKVGIFDEEEEWEQYIQRPVVLNK